MARWPLVLAAGWALALGGLPAAAHPADEANVYHYLWLEVRPQELTLQHATVVGGLLAGSVWPEIDRNGDGAAGAAEVRAHARGLARSLSLEVNGRRRAWTLRDQAYPGRDEFFGRAGPAPLALRLTAPLPALGPRGLRLRIRDETFPIFTGVFPQPVVKTEGAVAGVSVSENGRLVEVTLTPGKGTGISGDPDAAVRAPAPEAPPRRGSPELDPARLFPERGKVLYAPGGEPGHAHGPGPGHDHPETRALQGFLDRPLTPALFALALTAALLAGMAHALTPGHGKALVGAYLVGARGTVRDAILLGIVVTITHTAGVYLLGFLCLWLTSRIRVEVVGQWLSLTSGLLVLGMGFWLFQRGLLHFHGLRPLPGHAHGADGHSHEHAGAEAGHSHEPAGGPALGSQVHQEPDEPPPPPDSPHGGPVAAPSETRRGVIALGVAGGLVPCFDALAVLIAAVHLGRIELGLALIAAFSVGMALVLVAIGILMVKAKDFMARFTGEGPIVRALPAVSGGILFLLGAWLTFQSLVQAGVLRVGG